MSCSIIRKVVTLITVYGAQRLLHNYGPISYKTKMRRLVRLVSSDTDIRFDNMDERQQSVFAPFVHMSIEMRKRRTGIRSARFRAHTRAGRVVPISELVSGALTQNRSSLDLDLPPLPGMPHCGSCTIRTSP